MFVSLKFNNNIIYTVYVIYVYTQKHTLTNCLLAQCKRHRFALPSNIGCFGLISLLIRMLHDNELPFLRVSIVEFKFTCTNWSAQLEITYMYTINTKNYCKYKDN